MPPHRLVPLLFGLGLVGISCVDDAGHEPKSEPVGLALRASVAGLSQAVTYTVSVQVSYQIADGGSGLLDSDPPSFSITSGDPPVAHRIRIDLTRCLEDAARVDADSDACRLSVTLSLGDASGELARATQDLGLVREGDQVTPPEPIAITPSYTLTIAGGGPTTGSGLVTVAQVGEQPVVSCQITDGQAAATGCSGRYPLHTTLLLTATGSTLTAWEGDCTAAAAAAPCQLTMDGHRTAIASFTPLPTTGELAVQIGGLPAGTAAQVTVTNISGFSQLVTETSVLTGLLPGDYAITASPVLVPAEGRTYTPAPEQQSVTVVVGERAMAQIGYNPPETGSLAVAITGLPEGTAASVTVTGSDGFSQTLTAGQTLSGLEPGSYTVTAQDVETSDQIYAPTPLTQTQTVAANQTAGATVAYAATRASLTVTVTGLPTGVDGSITVAGPNGYRQNLTGTTVPPLTKLAPGSYTVEASSVTSEGGQAYDPVVTPEQPILIAAGSDVTVTVTYTAPPAVELVFTQQPANAVSGAAISPPVSVEIRDAQDRPVLSYATAVTLSLQGGTSGATLQGLSSVPQNGVAIFNDLSVDLVGTGYSLLANSGALPEATSSSFAVTEGPVSTERSTVEVSATVLRTCCGASTVTVTARDLNGNPVPGAVVTLAASGEGNIIVQPRETTNDQGIAVGTLASRVTGAKLVTATVNEITLISTVPIQVSAGIAFTLETSDNREIVVINPDGSDPVNLTRSENLEFDPEWSPDGSRIAFTGPCVDCTTNIYIMPADGLKPAIVVRNAFQPAWSPDGQRIAFTRFVCDDEQCQNEIFVLSLVDGSSVNLTSGIDTGASSPAWSPGGAHIAFTGLVCGEGCQTDVFVMNSDGSNPVNLTVREDAEEFAAAWSPDGGRIAFSARVCPDGCEYDVEVISANGSGRVNLTADFGEDALLPAWSPDGSRIAFSLLGNDIYVMNADGSSPQFLIADGFDPSWR